MADTDLKRTEHHLARGEWGTARHGAVICLGVSVADTGLKSTELHLARGERGSAVICLGAQHG